MSGSVSSYVCVAGQCAIMRCGRGLLYSLCADGTAIALVPDRPRPFIHDHWPRGMLYS